MGLEYKIPDDSAPVRSAKTNLETIHATLAGQLLPSSQETYRRDFTAFIVWMETRNLILASVTYQDIVAYREFVGTHYRPSTAQRMLTVVRRAYVEAMRLGMIQRNPVDGVRGFIVADESPRTALTLRQCKDMIEDIDRTTPRGKRDYALLSLLIQTGIRRSEVVALKVQDMAIDQGYYIAIIQHAKGDKRHIVKVPVAVHRAIEAYLLERGEVSPTDYVFVGISKTGIWKKTPIHPSGGLNYILQERAHAIAMKLTPHDLRATFATLALESAPLHKVQDAMGHKDPKTTQRYNRRRNNLDDNAVDHIHLIDE